MQHHTLIFPPEVQEVAQVTALFQALSDGTRLTLLLALRERERSVTELTELLSQPQSTVSRHLAVLRRQGLVQTRREAQRVHYRLADAHLLTLLQEAFSHAQHVLNGLPEH